MSRRMFFEIKKRSQAFNLNQFDRKDVCSMQPCQSEWELKGSVLEDGVSCLAGLQAVCGRVLPKRSERGFCGRVFTLFRIGCR